MSHDVFFLVTTKVPKRMRTTRDVERNWSWSQTESSNCQSRLFCTLLGRLGRTGIQVCTLAFGAGADQGHDGHDCKFRVHEVSEVRKTVSYAGRVQARSLVDGCKLGSRDVSYPIPEAGLLEERSTVFGGREDATRLSIPSDLTPLLPLLPKVGHGSPLPLSSPPLPNFAVFFFLPTEPNFVSTLGFNPQVGVLGVSGFRVLGLRFRV